MIDADRLYNCRAALPGTLGRTPERWDQSAVDVGNTARHRSAASRGFLPSGQCSVHPIARRYVSEVSGQ
jgi:hypothetical protein